jgi:hypothetical protein
MTFIRRVHFEYFDVRELAEARTTKLTADAKLWRSKFTGAWVVRWTEIFKEQAD